jgi:hypothetical protein
MRTVTAIAAAGALATLLLGAAPARADYDAIAFDPTTGDYAAGAADSVLGNCNSPNCAILLRIDDGLCGALATTADLQGWGTAVQDSVDDADTGAVQNCQLNNNQPCTVQVSDCNTDNNSD